MRIWRINASAEDFVIFVVMQLWVSGEGLPGWMKWWQRRWMILILTTAGWADIRERLVLSEAAQFHVHLALCTVCIYVSVSWLDRSADPHYWNETPPPPNLNTTIQKSSILLDFFNWIFQFLHMCTCWWHNKPMSHTKTRQKCVWYNMAAE